MIKELHVYRINLNDIPYIESIINNEKGKDYILSDITRFDAPLQPFTEDNSFITLTFEDETSYYNERDKKYETKH